MVRQPKQKSVVEADDSLLANSKIGAFGGPLEASMISGKNVRVPPMLEGIMQCLEHKHILERGLYRESGSSAVVADLKQLWNDHADRELEVLPIDFSSYRPHDMASVAKLFLRSLEEPLFTFSGYQRFLNCMKKGTETAQLDALAQLISRLPLCNIILLEYLLTHLSSLAVRQDENKMSPDNLGIVFAPSLLWPAVPSDAASAMTENQDLSRGMALLVSGWSSIRAKIHSASAAARAEFDAKHRNSASVGSKEDKKEERALAFDPSAAVLSRTKFDKRGSFGRFKTVFLELHGFKLSEYSAMSSKTAHSVTMLDLPGCKVANASELINEPNTFLLVARSDGKKKKGGEIRAFYRSTDADVCYAWLTSLRRAIGASEIASGRGTGANGLVDVTMFSDPCCVTDIAGTIVDANQACCDLLGWTQPSDIIGKSNKIMIPPHIAAHHDSYSKRHELTGSKRLIGLPREMKAMRRDGSLVSVLLSLGEIGDGEDKRLVATMRAAGKVSLRQKTTDSFSFSSASDHDDDQDSETDLAVTQFMDDITLCIERIHAEDRSRKESLQAKIVHIRAKNKLLTDIIQELDDEVRKLNSNSLLARRALDLLLANDCDGALQAHEQKKNQEDAKADIGVVKQCISAEVVAAPRSAATQMLFQANSFNSRKISAFMFVAGAKWLNDVLAPVLLIVRNNTSSLHIEHFGQADGDSAGVREVSRAIVSEAARILKAIQLSVNLCPDSIRGIFQFLQTCVRKQFGDSPAVDLMKLVNTFVFERFFIPAISAPAGFGLIIGEGSSNSGQVFGKIGRVLKHLADSTAFSSDCDVTSEAVNSFLRRKKSACTKIVKALLEEPRSSH